MARDSGMARRWKAAGAAAVVAALASGVMTWTARDDASAAVVTTCEQQAGATLANYEVAYQIDLPANAAYTGVPPYRVSRAAALANTPVGRVGYCLELDGQWVVATLPTPTTDVRHLGIPAIGTNIFFQQPVTNMSVRSNVAGVPNEDGLSGNIEFWPNSYSQENNANVPGAGSGVWDSGDRPVTPQQGYGSMQIHASNNRTVFAYNRFGVAGDANDDLGIGRSPIGNSDWTFRGTAGAHTKRRLTVFIRRANGAGTTDLTLTGVAPNSYVGPGETRNLTASVATPAQIARVEFLEGDRVVANDAVEPYTATWTATAPGATTLSARIVTTTGAIIPGTPVPLTVTGSACEAHAGDVLGGYEMLYQLDIPLTSGWHATGAPYRVDNSSRLAGTPVSKVAYCLQVDGRWVLTAFDAPSPEASRLGVPTLNTGITHARAVTGLQVRSNVAGVPTGDGMTGNIEFWPNNYGTENTRAVAGATDAVYDAGDRVVADVPSGYGSMQVHAANNAVLWAFNRWGLATGAPDVGIGRRPTGHPDWTFSGSAAQSTSRRLTVFVARPIAAVTDHGGVVSGALIPRIGGAATGDTTISGAVTGAGVTAMSARVIAADGSIVFERTTALETSRPAPFNLPVSIPARLERFTVEVTALDSGARRVVHRATDVVAGDVYVITGQSNSVGWAFESTDALDSSPFIRSFGTTVLDPATSVADRQWYRATSHGGAVYSPGRIGAHGLRFARRVMDHTGVPVAVLSGGKGGERIGYFQRNDANPTDASTSYGRLLQRLRAARLDRGVAGVLWYQGESDRFEAEVHRAGFLALRSDWQADFPNLRLIEVTQVRNLGCNTNNVELKDVQRRLGREFADITTVSTDGLPGFDGCHYNAEGYRRLGERWARVALHRQYGGADADGTYSPDVWAARFTSAARNEVDLVMVDADDTLRVTAADNLSVRSGGATINAVGAATVAGQPGVVRVRLASAATAGATFVVLGMNPTPNVANVHGAGLTSGLTPILEVGVAVPAVDRDVAR